jgi:glucose-6-phosphate isomerase
MGDPFPYAQGLKYLRGKGIRTLFFSELLGTRFSLWEASCPSLTIYIERLDAYAMGALLFLFEMVTVFIAHLIQVDPFTQEGVERGKLYTRVLLGKEGLEEEKTRMEGALKGGTSIRFP